MRHISDLIVHMAQDNPSWEYTRMPGGSLAVKQGGEVVPIINKLAQSFQNVVIMQDWHHPRHVSFASQHPGKKPFEQLGSRT
jgi:nicotinamidase-related amidase